MNTHQDDINKAAQKIIAGAERIQRFVENTMIIFLMMIRPN
ncbi:hypothetical protein ABN225_03220 [Providencia alcalifaciens]